MANIIINRTREATLSTDTFIKGMWKLEVVCPNGEVKKPLGDKMRPNLLMTRGLLNLAGAAPSSAQTFAAIASLMNVAQYGNQVSDPTSRDQYNGETNSINSINNDTQLGIFGYSDTSALTVSGTVQDNYTTGSRTFTKTYDFLAVPNLQTVKEIFITNGSGRSTGKTNAMILSRFILPSVVVLEQYQFLRLTYSLQVTIPALITPININVQSGDFNGLGLLKFVGLWDHIFGSMTSTGGAVVAQVLQNYSSGSPTSKLAAWTLCGSAAGTAGGVSGALMPGGSPEGITQIDFPNNVNTSFVSNPIQSASTYVASNGPGGSNTNLTYSNSNLSYSRAATLLFPATNPNVENAYIGGIFFNPQTLYITPSITDRAGWYWKFTDGSGAPRGQLKDINFALAVNLIHTASIT